MSKMAQGLDNYLSVGSSWDATTTYPEPQIKDLKQNKFERNMDKLNNMQFLQNGENIQNRFKPSLE